MSDDLQLRQQIALDVQEIRLLARAIETPAQFEAIMASVVDPHMQREIRTLLIPLLRFEVHGSTPSDPRPAE